MLMMRFPYADTNSGLRICMSLARTTRPTRSSAKAMNGRGDQGLNENRWRLSPASSDHRKWQSASYRPPFSIRASHFQANTAVAASPQDLGQERVSSRIAWLELGGRRYGGRCWTRTSGLWHVRPALCQLS